MSEAVAKEAVLKPNILIRLALSKNRPLLFAGIFAVLGCLFVLRSLAATPVVVRLQAEQMKLPAGASIVNSSSASGGEAVRMTANGTLTGSVNIPAGSSATSMTVVAHGNSCSGWATMAVSVDGTVVIPAKAMSDTSWTNYSAQVALASGTHTISITGSNIARPNSCNRKLYVDVTRFYGPTGTTAPTIAFSASPAAVGVGSSSTLTWSSTHTSSCTASGAWSGNEPTSGSVSTGALNTSSQYSLTCTGSGGTAKATAMVTVSAPTPVTTPSPAPGSGSWWKPTSSSPVSWNWVIGNAPATPYKAVNVYDIDGFDNSAATVQALHAQGSKVICYIDVGTYEPGRPDLNLIPAADIGSGVQGWPGEKWLNVADVNGLSALVKSRMQMCASKGFDAIEPDNIDGYTNATGFPLSGAQQITYNQFLASTAHSLGLSIGLKNDVDQTSQLAPAFDWALDEECNKYSECNTMAPFTSANKAVFNAEYTSDGETTAKFCSADAAAHINGVLFDLNLDGATYQPCTQAW